MNMALHLTIQSDLFVIVGLTAVLCLAVVLISKENMERFFNFFISYS